MRKCASKHCAAACTTYPAPALGLHGDNGHTSTHAPVNSKGASQLLAIAQAGLSPTNQHPAHPSA